MRLANITIVLILLFLISSVPLACGCGGVKIPDPGLEKVIREAINKPKGAIFPSDLEEINEIIVPLGLYIGMGPREFISDLTGLEYCVNLETIHITLSETWEIYDLSPLTLTEIYDLSPLASLTNLRTLDIAYSKINDLTSLSSLNNLTMLLLGSNQISDISPLALLTNLTSLDLEYNQISNVSSLAGLTNLEYLYLDDNQISDILPLASLTNLSKLWVSDNQISDISPLLSLTKLHTLYLRGNPLSSTSIEVYIPQLEERGVYVSW